MNFTALREITILKEINHENVVKVKVKTDIDCRYFLRGEKLIYSLWVCWDWLDKDCLQQINCINWKAYQRNYVSNPTWVEWDT